MNKELLGIYQMHHFLLQSAERLYLAFYKMATYAKDDPYHLFPAWHMEFTIGALEVQRARSIIEETWSFSLPAPNIQKSADDWRHLLPDPAQADAFWDEWLAHGKDMPPRNNLVFSFPSRNVAKSMYAPVCMVEQLAAQAMFVASHCDPRTMDDEGRMKYLHMLHAFGPQPLHEGGMSLVQGTLLAARPYRYDIEEFIKAATAPKNDALDAFLSRLSKGGQQDA